MAKGVVGQLETVLTADVGPFSKGMGEARAMMGGMTKASAETSTAVAGMSRPTEQVGLAFSSLGTAARAAGIPVAGLETVARGLGATLRTTGAAAATGWAALLGPLALVAGGVAAISTVVNKLRTHWADEAEAAQKALEDQNKAAKVHEDVLLAQDLRLAKARGDQEGAWRIQQQQGGEAAVAAINQRKQAELKAVFESAVKANTYGDLRYWELVKAIKANAAEELQRELEAQRAETAAHVTELPPGSTLGNVFGPGRPELLARPPWTQPTPQIPAGRFDVSDRMQYYRPGDDGIPNVNQIGYQSGVASALSAPQYTAGQAAADTAQLTELKKITAASDATARGITKFEAAPVASLVSN